MAKRQKVFTHAEFLHPQTCGSSIRYSLCATEHMEINREGMEECWKRFEGTIWLSECSRSIEWSGYGLEGIEELKTKVLKAQQILAKFLVDLDKIEKVYNIYKAEDE